MKKTGFTILELLVSIVILSVVLTLAMNLFLKVRSAYINEKNNIEMEISRSIIIDAVMSDVISLGVKNVTCSQNTMTIRFNGDEEVIKTLVFDSTNTTNDYIKYYGEENAYGTVRKLPKGSIVGNLNCTKKEEIQFIQSNDDNYIINHVYNKIEDEKGYDYSIDLLFYSKD